MSRWDWSNYINGELKISPLTRLVSEKNFAPGERSMDDYPREKRRLKKPGELAFDSSI